MKEKIRSIGSVGVVLFSTLFSQSVSAEIVENFQRNPVLESLILGDKEIVYNNGIFSHIKSKEGKITGLKDIDFFERLGNIDLMFQIVKNYYENYHPEVRFDFGIDLESLDQKKLFHSIDNGFNELVDLSEFDDEDILRHRVAYFINYFGGAKFVYKLVNSNYGKHIEGINTKMVSPILNNLIYSQLNDRNPVIYDVNLTRVYIRDTKYSLKILDKYIQGSENVSLKDLGKAIYFLEYICKYKIISNDKYKKRILAYEKLIKKSKKSGGWIDLDFYKTIDVGVNEDYFSMILDKMEKVKVIMKKLSSI